MALAANGAYPHKTKDPVVLAAQIVLALQTIVSREIAPGEPAVVTVGSIHGGTKHNIIPDEVRLQLTVRSYTDESQATDAGSYQAHRARAGDSRRHAGRSFAGSEVEMKILRPQLQRSRTQRKARWCLQEFDWRIQRD